MRSPSARISADHTLALVRRQLADRLRRLGALRPHLLDLGDQRAPPRIGREHGVDLLRRRHADRRQRALHLVGPLADEPDVEHAAARLARRARRLARAVRAGRGCRRSPAVSVEGVLHQLAARRAAARATRRRRRSARRDRAADARAEVVLGGAARSAAACARSTASNGAPKPRCGASSPRRRRRCAVERDQVDLAERAAVVARDDRVAAARAGSALGGALAVAVPVAAARCAMRRERRVDRPEPLCYDARHGDHPRGGAAHRAAGAPAAQRRGGSRLHRTARPHPRALRAARRARHQRRRADRAHRADGDAVPRRRRRQPRPIPTRWLANSPARDGDFFKVPKIIE